MFALPSLSLPQSIQRRLVAFILRRTLGKCFKLDTDDALSGLETDLASGRVVLTELELDTNVC